MSRSILGHAAPAAIAALLTLACPAAAQMQLPGAVMGGAGSATHEGGGAGGGAGGGPPPPPKPVVIEAPSEDTILGRILSRDGTKGAMTFEKAGAGLALTKLTFAGENISRPGQACTVDVPLSAPLTATPDGRPAGALRYTVHLQACPFNIDILTGAALVTSAEPTCEFAAAECRVSPGGLWGPHAADITPKQAQDLEHERVRLESTMRANFRALLRKAGKDRTAVKAIAADQAAFSSEREMTCRDYQDETQHGFCSTQITEARALALLAQFGPVKATHERRFTPRAKAVRPSTSDRTAERPEP